MINSHYLILNSPLVREIGDNAIEAFATEQRNIIMIEKVNEKLIIYAVRDRMIKWRGTIDDLLHLIEDWQYDAGITPR